jgi:hypothetical protein
MLLVSCIRLYYVVTLLVFETMCFAAVDDQQRNWTWDTMSFPSAINYSAVGVKDSNMFSLSTENRTELSENHTAKPITMERVVITEVTTGPAVTEVDSTLLNKYLLAHAIIQYFSPFLIVIATVGNIMSVIILQHPSFRKSSTSFILSALAIVDLEMVNTGLIREWLLFISNMDVRLLSPFGCKLHVFLVYCVPMVRLHNFFEALYAELQESTVCSSRLYVM